MAEVTLGPSSDTYRELPIPEWIEARGFFWDFERTIGHDDGCELSTLGDDECVICPGLIYKLRPAEEPANG